MNSNERNIDILEHIREYCDEIFETQAYFGNSFEVFKANTIYRNAVAMCILQIGELSGHLTDSFKETYSGVPWRNIKGMRNIMAHKYGDISVTAVWEAIIDDVPVLRDYCNSILEKYSVLEQPAVKDEE
jgi:uncharacterized protein with HEPN domain